MKRFVVLFENGDGEGGVYDAEDFATREEAEALYEEKLRNFEHERQKGIAYARERQAKPPQFKVWFGYRQEVYLLDLLKEGNIPSYVQSEAEL